MIKNRKKRDDVVIGTVCGKPAYAYAAHNGIYVVMPIDSRGAMPSRPIAFREIGIAPKAVISAHDALMKAISKPMCPAAQAVALRDLENAVIKAVEEAR